MNLIYFIKEFPDEASCKAKFKAFREQVDVVCPKCGCCEHYWKTDKECYECKYCSYHQGLKANTVIHKSRLPFRYWFIAMHLLPVIKKSFSVKELQRQLEYKRYYSIWHMAHKLRTTVCMRDGGEYVLTGRIELDEGYFSTEMLSEQKAEPLKRGRCSHGKIKVLVMA